MTAKVTMILGKGFLTLALATVLAAQASAASFQLDAATRVKIDAEAQRLVDEHRTPGLAIGIMSDGKIVYAKGFGSANLETGAPVTPDSVFMIGSITKQFTAAAIMLLAEQGKLAIDDPISRHLHDFPRGDEVTIRQLLTHTSGIHPTMAPGSPPTPEQAVRVGSTADMIALIQGIDPLYNFEPGTSSEYSNSNYWLLGAIVEKLSGLSLADFMKQNLFDRAGMTASAMDDATEVVPGRVSGYNAAPVAGHFIKPRGEYIRASGGAGGIRSTIGDMLRWQDALLAGRVISPESVKTMMGTAEVDEASSARASNAPRGFGLVIRNENGHAFTTAAGGSTQGFTANIKAYPDDRVAMVVLTNIGPGLGGAPPAQGPRMVRRGPPPREPGQQPAQGPRILKKGPGGAGQGPRRTQGGGQRQRASGAAPEALQFLSELITGPRPARSQ